MATLTVGKAGSGKNFTTISAAVTAAHTGDVIYVSADHVYTNDFPVIKKSLTLQAVDGEVKMVATIKPPNGKAMIVEGAVGLSIVINGFDISGVQVNDQNGAAIRYEGGSLTLKNVYFHDNQEGLLGGNDAAGSIRIDHSEFARNGYGDGYTHGIYVGRIANLSVTNSYFHDMKVGHAIKSRAANNTITGNRIFDLNSNTSYSIDLPNAGNATISGNVIQQGTHAGNNYIIAYGEEGGSNPGRTVSISNNTIVNDLGGGKAILNKTTTSLGFTNNKLWNLTGSQLSPNGPITTSGNVNLASRPSLDTSSLTFINPATGSAPPAQPPQEPSPPTTPPTGSSDPVLVAAYHLDVAKDFEAYASTHPTVFHDAKAMVALQTELSSKTVLLTPPAGDLWS